MTAKPKYGQSCPPSRQEKLSAESAKRFEQAAELLQRVDTRLQAVLTDHPGLLREARIAVVDARGILLHHSLDERYRPVSEPEDSMPEPLTEVKQ